MNILTDEELAEHINASHTRYTLSRAIEAAVLSKLAEQAGEPVGYYENGRFSVSSDGGPDKWRERKEYAGAIYTSHQLIAAQQRTAEACAEYVVRGLHDDDPFIIAAGIRDEVWREYL